MEVSCLIGACMIVRRKAIDQVGYLDEDYFLFFEETDWCYRMKKAGWKVFHVPQAKIYHYQGKSAERKEEDASGILSLLYIFYKKNRGKLQCVYPPHRIVDEIGFPTHLFSPLFFHFIQH